MITTTFDTSFIQMAYCKFCQSRNCLMFCWSLDESCQSEVEDMRHFPGPGGVELTRTYRYGIGGLYCETETLKTLPARPKPFFTTF